MPALWPRTSAWRDPLADDDAPAPVVGWRLERYSDNNELGTLLAVVGGLVVFWLRAVWVPT